MPTTIKKLEDKISTHTNKREILKKINKSTQIITNSTILPLLKKKGAVESLFDRRNLSLYFGKCNEF